MGIIRDGIMGPVYNKVGPTVGRGFRGQNVLTGLYEKKSQKPPSADQLKHQDRLGMLSSLLSDAGYIVEPGFKKFAKKGLTPYNAAYKFNAPHAFMEDENGIRLNLPKIVFSRGPVETPNCPSFELAGADKLRFSWLPEADNAYCRYNDSASFLIFVVEADKMMVFRNHALRADLAFEFEIPPPYLGMTFHGFMCFENADGKLVGDSRYVGVVE